MQRQVGKKRAAGECAVSHRTKDVYRYCRIRLAPQPIDSSASKGRLWLRWSHQSKILHPRQKVAAVQYVVKRQPRVATSKMRYELFKGLGRGLCRDAGCPQVSGISQSGD